MTTLTQQVIKSAFWQFSLKVVLILLRLVFLAIVSRILTERDFGIVQAVTTIIFLVTQIGMLGLGRAIIQRAEVDYRHISVAFWSFVMLGLFLSVVLWLIGGAVANAMDLPELEKVLHFIFLLPLVLSLGGLSRHLLMKDMDFKRLALYEFTAFVIGYFVIGIAMALNGFGYWSLVAAIAGEAIVATFFIYIFNPAQIRFYFNFALFKSLFAYGGMDSAAQVAGLVGNKVDTFFINAGFGTAMLGVYNRATALTNTNINLVSEVIDKVFFSAFSKKGHSEGQLSGFTKANVALTIFSVPFTTFCIFSASEIVTIVLGHSWQSVIPVFAILCVSIPFRLLNKVGLQLLRAQNKMVQVVTNQILYLLFSLILLTFSLGGDYLYMMVMISGSYILTYFITSINVKLANKSYKYIELYKNFKYPILLSIIYAIICFVLSEQSFFMELSVYYRIFIKAILIILLFMINFYDSNFKSLIRDFSKMRTT